MELTLKAIFKICVLAFFFPAFYGCDHSQACPYDSGSGFAGAFPTFTPGTDSVRLGTSVRLDLAVPYHLYHSYDSSAYYAGRLKNFFSQIEIHNQRKISFTGSSKIVIGAADAPLDSTNNQALIFFDKADTGALFSIYLLPADTGLYYVRFLDISSGPQCSFYVTDISIPGGNHGYLAFPDSISAGDSAYTSHKYYFSVY